MLIPENVHPSWDEFLTNDRKEEVNVIFDEIKQDFTPSDSKLVLRFLERDLNKVKVIWLGQDPYPIKGKASGRAFEDATIKDWTDKGVGTSIKNVIRSIYRMENNIEDYKDVKTYKKIQKEIKNGAFNIKPPKKWFDSLENQDVLFLNVYFTCKVGSGNEGTHRGIWKDFSFELLKYINSKNPDIVWFLWGNPSRKIGERLQFVNTYCGIHPSRQNMASGEDILDFEGFRVTKNMINWLGK
ncbi:uracil-DNA glycosylase [Bacillus cereus group sp. BfR-BA-01328]|uniref:uracil-DNA glycosylase n=1 Tax=Bacillus cereus group sp. BfR-BA-01328 TaxID=2920304 RepID=UPI001F5B00AB